MKLEKYRVQAFFRDPGAIRGVLLYGEDGGLIRARAAALVRAVVGQADDPFRVADLDRERQNRLGVEMTAQSLIGGRRVVRVREVSDALTPSVLSALEAQSDALLVVESGVLPTKSKLRVLFEERSDTMAVACFREEAGGLEQTIRAELVARNVTIDPPALEWLTGQLGADYGSTRQELEKLALYVGPGGRVDVAAAMQCVGDSAALQLEDALFAAISGDIAGTDRALEAALAEGASPVGVLRMALTHLQRLQRARAAVDDRVSVADAVRALRPPIFVRRVGAFTAAVRQWSSVSLAGACDFVSSAERDCKRTGAPAEALCRNVLLSLARRASARSG